MLIEWKEGNTTIIEIWSRPDVVYRLDSSGASRVTASGAEVPLPYLVAEDEIRRHYEADGRRYRFDYGDTVHMPRRWFGWIGGGLLLLSLVGAVLVLWLG